MGTYPLVGFYLLLLSTLASIWLMKWAAATMVENGPRFANWVGFNCLGFIALSFWVAVRRAKRQGVLKRALAWLEGIPLAVALIAALAYASIAGSVYSAVEPAFGKLFIFHSLWFVFLILFLAINLVLCSYDKSLQVLMLPGRRDFRTGTGFYTGLRQHQVVDFAAPSQDAIAVFKQTYPRAHVDGTTAYAQRGIFARFGPTVVHIGLLLSMAAGGYRILSERIGFRVFRDADPTKPIQSAEIMGLGLFDSQIQIQEGQTKDLIRVKKHPMTPFSSSNSREVRLDFQVKCHNFEAEMYPGTQVPRYFASLLEITSSDGERLLTTVDMNTAATFRGYKFSQNSYSMMPQIKRSTYEVVDVTTGNRLRTDVGPNTRNWISPKADKRNLQLSIEADAVGEPWRLLDASNGDKLLAEGTIIEASGGLKVVPVRYFPDFEMTDTGPISKTDDPNNPALLVQLQDPSAPVRFAFLFQSPQLPSVNMPDGIEGRLLEIRAVGSDTTSTMRTTGDTRPVPMEGTATPPKGLEGREFLLHVTEAGTGRTLARVWSDDSRPVEVAASALPQTGEDTALAAALERARAKGDRYIVRRIGPTEGFMTVLGVIRDPSLPYLYLGCLIVIFGVFQCFCMTYREAWLLHDGGKVYLGMKSRGSGDSPQHEFQTLAKRLAEVGRMPAPDAVPSPADGNQQSPPTKTRKKSRSTSKA